MPTESPTVDVRVPQAFLPHILPMLENVAADLHSRPEVRFEEVHAAARLANELEDAGFTVERGYAGLSTSFVGRWETPEVAPQTPTIAIFLEYDALEGLGHACGHNLIAAAGLGAAVLVQRALQANATPARLVVVGSPAEEQGGGKVPMIDAGILDDVDFAIMVHPAGENSVDGAMLSRVALNVSFTGRASHAAVSPALGRNALDAVTVSLVSIGLLRQQLSDPVRVHAIVTDGGQAVNIIPEAASLRVLVRAHTREHLDNDVLPRVRACFEGAALATGCDVEITEPTPPYHPLISNPTLAGLAAEAYRQLGRSVNLTPPMGGSTDMGNVSQIVPSIHPMIELAPNLTLHTREFATAAGDAALARDVIADGATMLAAVALAAIENSALIDQAKAEFAAQQ